MFVSSFVLLAQKRQSVGKGWLSGELRRQLERTFQNKPGLKAGEGDRGSGLHAVIWNTGINDSPGDLCNRLNTSITG